LREIEISHKLNAEAEPFTPRRVTRQSATGGKVATARAGKKASAAETVLLKALGITPADLSVKEEELETFRELFDSPLRDQHLRVVASIFGKMMPSNLAVQEACQVEVTVQ
jgi:hypothetical protein